jgi:hypothetical protein
MIVIAMLQMKTAPVERSQPGLFSVGRSPTQLGRARSKQKSASVHALARKSQALNGACD